MICVTLSQLHHGSGSLTCKAEGLGLGANLGSKSVGSLEGGWGCADWLCTCLPEPLEVRRNQQGAQTTRQVVKGPGVGWESEEVEFLGLVAAKMISKISKACENGGYDDSKCVGSTH